MPLTPSDILNLVNLTRKSVDHGIIADLAMPLTEYVAMKQLLTKKRMKKAHKSYGYSFTCLTGHNNSTRAVGLDDNDVSSIVNNTTTGETKFRLSTMTWALDKLVVDMNSGSEEQLYQYVKTQRQGGWLSQAATWERWFWGLTGASDTVTPFGYGNVIVKNATEGLNGAAPTGYSTVMNISPTTYPMWKNWTAQYTNFTRDDLGAKLRKAMEFTKFMSPVEGINSYEGTIDRGIYTTWVGYDNAKELCLAQNEDLGMDLDPNGDPMIRRIPFVHVPALNYDATLNTAGDQTNPYIGIDWNTFGMAFLDGWQFKESPEIGVANQHRKVVVHTDTMANILCTSRRNQFILATGTTDPTTNSPDGTPNVSVI